MGHFSEKGELADISGTDISGHRLYVRQKCLAARQASLELASLATLRKNAALEAIGEALHKGKAKILRANAKDMRAGEQAGMGARLDRLLLTDERVESMREAIATVVGLPDPVGVELETRQHANGMQVQKVRCPLGVVGMIYEARPNVGLDAAVLCIKSGNAAVLKGGSDARHSHQAIVKVIHQGLEQAGLPPAAVQLLNPLDREITTAFLQMRGLVDVLIPRGGLELIRFTQQHSRIPVIETGASVVHAYVDEEVDAEQAVELILNAKMRRVSICSALDTLLLHKGALAVVGPLLARRLAERQPPVEVCADARALPVFAQALAAPQLKPLVIEKDYDTEFLDYRMAVGTVDSMQEALDHIAVHSLKHTEAIYTTNAQKAQRFMQQVDAACVMHNVSTQFVDGGEFGLGAEIGISTQKLHVRGPFALEGLTGMKWEVRGNGQLRP